MECKQCNSKCIKAGKQQNGKQKYVCKQCNLYQQKQYTYAACKPEVQEQFTRLNGMGCGARKMAIFLGISITTLQRWLEKAFYLQPVYSFELGGIYDIDELQTYVARRKNNVWVAIPKIILDKSLRCTELY